MPSIEHSTQVETARYQNHKRSFRVTGNILHQNCRTIRGFDSLTSEESSRHLQRRGRLPAALGLRRYAELACMLIAVLQCA